MDDILAKKNRHLFLEEKDNVGNSFIANVNNIANDLDNIDAVANDLEKIDIVADNIDNVNTAADSIIGNIGSIIGNASVVATGSTEGRTLADRFSDIINVKDFGAKGDGITDDTAAFKAAASISDSSSIFIPAGTYKVNDNISSSFVTFGNVTFNGTGIVSTIKNLKAYPVSENILDRAVIIGSYNHESITNGEVITSSQGFTIDTTRNCLIVALIGESYQEIRKLNPITLEVLSTVAFTSLGHANSLCYIPSADEIYVVPLLSDNNNILVYVLDANTLSIKRSEVFLTPNAVGQVALSYDKVRNNFVMCQPVTLDQSDNVVTRVSDNQNGLWIRVCDLEFNSLEEFTISAPANFSFGTGNSIACNDGFLIGSSFRSVYTIDINTKSLISIYQTDVDRLEVEDFDFGTDGTIWCQAAPYYMIARFDGKLVSRETLGSYERNSAKYFPGSLDIDIDLNDFLAPGQYAINTTGTHLKNSPSGVNGILIVSGMKFFKKQIWMRWGTPGSTDSNVFFRTYAYSNDEESFIWGVWHHVVVGTGIQLNNAEGSDDGVSLHNGSQAADGAGIWLYRLTNQSYPGMARLQATDGTLFFNLTLNNEKEAYFGGLEKVFSHTEAIFGTPNKRWGQIYTTTSPDTSSDERLKDNISDIPDEVINAWEDINWIQYKFKKSISEKGNSARLHTGLIAQNVDSVFKNHNLNASDYGLFCYDEWDDQPEQLDDEGNLISPHIPAGNEYSIRYEEALCLEAAYQRWLGKKRDAKIEALMQRISALENNQ